MSRLIEIYQQGCALPVRVTSELRPVSAAILAAENWMDTYTPLLAALQISCRSSRILGKDSVCSTDGGEVDVDLSEETAAIVPPVFRGKVSRKRNKGVVVESDLQKDAIGDGNAAGSKDLEKDKDCTIISSEAELVFGAASIPSSNVDIPSSSVDMSVVFGGGVEVDVAGVDADEETETRCEFDVSKGVNVEQLRRVVRLAQDITVDFAEIRLVFDVRAMFWIVYFLFSSDF